MACNQTTFSYKMNLKVRKIEIVLKNSFYSLLIDLYLMTLIERVGEKRVGFSCCKLFTILDLTK